MARKAEKAALRKSLRDQLAALSQADLAAASHAACRRLCRTDDFAAARTVMLFLSLPGEIDTALALDHAFAAGKTVAVPSVHWDRLTMDAVLLPAREAPLETGRYGLRTPTAPQPVLLEQIDLVVIPGLAFDRTGHRLGRGAGFYDAFLAQPHLQATRCGLGLHLQLLPQLPVGPKDVPLHLLVTDKTVLYFQKNREKHRDPC